MAQEDFPNQPLIDTLPLKRPIETRDWMRGAVGALAVLVVVYYFAAFLYIAFQRIHYQFVLDWVEGESLIQVARLLKGQLLYVRPSYEYVALTYPPVYFYASALVARIFGLNMFSLRLVSLLSSLACMALIYLICRKAGTRVLPAVLASGFFAATYQLSGTWFDVARTDMLGTALVLSAVYCLPSRTRLSYFAAGLSLALACLTKQTNLLVLLLFCVYLALLDRRGLPLFSLGSIGTLVLVTLALDRYFAGWYRFYTITSAFGSSGSPAMTPSLIMNSIPEFWLRGILQPLPIAAAFIVVYALAALGFRLKLLRDSAGKVTSVPRITFDTPSPDDRRGTWFYLFCAAGMIGTSWGSIAHQGSFNNDLVPAFAIAAVLLGLSIEHFGYRHQTSVRRTSLIIGALLLQLALMYYPIGSQIPTSSDLLAGQALVTKIREQPGEIYVAFHPELALMAGKPTHASWDSLFQLEGNYGGGDAKETRRVKAEFSVAMARQEFSMIILDKDLNWVWGHPEKYYELQADPVFHRPDVFWPVTGWQVRPTFVMYPMSP